MNAPLTTRAQQHLFAQLSETEQQRELTGRREERSFAYERASASEKDRTIWMSIASERLYERWWGNEILEVSRAAIRAERLDSGAPILVDHSTRDQVGVIDAWEITQDKKVRVLARFGKSARAEEVWRDVLDGIRKNTSIGYIIHKAVLVEKNEDINTYRVTDWEPLEGSLVAVPADPSVGPGRALEAPQIKGSTMESQIANNAASQGADPDQLVASLRTDNAAARADERKQIAKRNADIIAEGAAWPEYGGPDLALKAISDPQMTVPAFQSAMLKMLGEKHRPTRTGELEADRQPGNEGGRASYGMGARDMLHAAKLTVFKGLGKLHNMEDHQVAFRAGQWLKAVVYGDANAFRWCRDAGVQLYQGQFDGARFQGQAVERAVTEGIFTSGGWLVPSEMSTAIIANREEYGVARRICNMIPMSTATMSLPRITSGITAYFVGELNGPVTGSDPAGDQVNLALKDLMATTPFGKSTAQDSAIPLAEMIAREQARARAVKEDNCLILGDGTSTYGGILGLKTLLDNASYTGGRALAASGHDTFPEIDVGDVTAVLGLLPVYARAGARWLCTGIFDTMVFGRLKLGAGGNNVQTVQGRIVEGDYAGFPISYAHDMPAGGGTTYNLATILLFGNFNLGVAFGFGEQMMMTVDPFTLAKWNQTEITTVERIDINCHGVNKSTTAAGPIVALHGRT